MSDPSLNQASGPLRLVILTPVYEDCDACATLALRLDDVLAANNLSARILIVDDGSTVPIPEGFCGETFHSIDRVDVVHLRTNLGHQRAIAIGLAHAHEEIPLDAVVIMDSDGEDRPEDVPRLVRRFVELDGSNVVFADRSRRSEGALFKFFYLLYKVICWTLTSTRVRVGNFSVLSARHLSRLVAVSDLWNHYAAAVFNARIPRTSIPTTRGTRYSGKSSMSFVGLVTHGLSALAVFSAVAGVRLLMACLMCLLLFVAGILAVLFLQMTSMMSVPLWAIVSAGVLGTLLSQLILLAFGLVFFILNGRDRLSFLPLRDYRFFVERVITCYSKND